MASGSKDRSVLCVLLQKGNCGNKILKTCGNINLNTRNDSDNNYSSRGPSLPCCLGSVTQCTQRVKCWSYIQIYGYRVVSLWLTTIIVYNVPHPATTSVHYPVMTIKGKFVPGGGTHVIRDTGTQVCNHPIQERSLARGEKSDARPLKETSLGIPHSLQLDKARL